MSLTIRIKKNFLHPVYKVAPVRFNFTCECIQSVFCFVWYSWDTATFITFSPLLQYMTHAINHSWVAASVSLFPPLAASFASLTHPIILILLLPSTISLNLITGRASFASSVFSSNWFYFSSSTLSYYYRFSSLFLLLLLILLLLLFYRLNVRR